MPNKTKAFVEEATLILAPNYIKLSLSCSPILSKPRSLKEIKLCTPSNATDPDTIIADLEKMLLACMEFDRWKNEDRKDAISGNKNYYQAVLQQRTLGYDEALDCGIWFTHTFK